MRLMLLLVLCALLVPGVASAQSPGSVPNREIDIGVVVDGPSPRYDEGLARFQREIESLLRQDFVVKFPTDKRLIADYTQAGVQKALDQLLADPKVDVVLAHGVLASNLATKYASLPKLCVAPFVVSEEAQDLLDRAGKRKSPNNLSYVVWSLDVERDLKAFAELGDFKTLGWVYPREVGTAMPKLLSHIEAEARKLGTKIRFVPAGSSADQVLAGLPKDIDAVYVAPNPQLSYDEIGKLAQGLIERQLPSFSWFGKSEVERGLLAGLAAPEDFDRLARRVALNLQSILLGEPAPNQSTAFKQSEQLVINMETARALNVWPNFVALTDAVLLDAKRERVTRRLTLEKAVREAMKSNVDLRVAKERVAASEQDIALARASMLPRLALTASASMIDQDRAGLGTAERVAQWGGSLTVPIVAERAWGGVDIQKQVYASRQEEENAIRLDVTRLTALSYLTLLQAQTIERIQRENASLSRENLALARLRNQIGTAGPGEVLRWETQIANARTGVIDAIAGRNEAEITLNRLLDRPLEEPFLTSEATLDDPNLLSSDPRFRSYLENPLRFKVLREFMVEEAFRTSPELKQVDSLKRATKRRLASAKRSLYVPTVGLSASAAHQFYRGGVGSEPVTLPPGSPPIPLPNPDRFNWYVGVSAELPLYEGGARYADVTQSEREYAALEAQRRSTELLIAERVRASLHQMGAAFAAIRLSTAAAQASRGNLLVVTDAYTRGTAPVITLLDAQNQALVADLAAANAVYGFLARLIDVERAIGRFGFFMSRSQRNDLFNRLSKYQERRAAKVTTRSNTKTPGQ